MREKKEKEASLLRAQQMERRQKCTRPVLQPCCSQDCCLLPYPGERGKLVYRGLGYDQEEWDSRMSSTHKTFQEGQSDCREGKEQRRRERGGQRQCVGRNWASEFISDAQQMLRGLCKLTVDT